MPTQQETFDTVVAHLRRQGKRAMSDDGDTCVYRAPDGSKCAAGCLIPDSAYVREMEGNLVGCTLGNNIVNDLIHSLGHDTNLVGRLQLVHDSADPQHWEGGLLEAATDFGLKYTPPEAA